MTWLRNLSLPLSLYLSLTDPLTRRSMLRYYFSYWGLNNTNLHLHGQIFENHPQFISRWKCSDLGAPQPVLKKIQKISLLGKNDGKYNFPPHQLTDKFTVFFSNVSGYPRIAAFSSTLIAKSRNLGCCKILVFSPIASHFITSFFILN